MLQIFGANSIKYNFETSKILGKPSKYSDIQSCHENENHENVILYAIKVGSLCMLLIIIKSDSLQ